MGRNRRDAESTDFVFLQRIATVRKQSATPAHHVADVLSEAD